MKFGLPIILLFLFVTFVPAYGQGSQEIYAKNKVKKIFEYDALDSLNFMKEHPNGSYSAYNEDGQRIEYNWYSMKLDKDNNEVFEECKTYEIYDYYSGERIGSVSINPTSEEPVQDIDLNEKDAKTGKIKSVQMRSGYVSFGEKTDEKRDTIHVSKFHKRIYWYGDSSFIEDLYLNSSLLIDSTILTFRTYPFTKGSGPKDDRKSRVKSIYGIQNGLNLMMKCEHSDEPYKHLDWIWEMKYLENGLLDFVYKYSLNDKEKHKTQYSYVYKE